VLLRLLIPLYFLLAGLPLFAQQPVPEPAPSAPSQGGPSDAPSAFPQPTATEPYYSIPPNPAYANPSPATGETYPGPTGASGYPSPPDPSQTPPPAPDPSQMQPSPGTPGATTVEPVPVYEEEEGLPAAESDGTDEETTQLFLPNQDIHVILERYQELTGRRVIPDQTVAGNLTLNIPRVTKEEAIRIIETALLLNGYTLLPGDNNITKVLGPGKQAKSAGMPILSNKADIPPGEQVITFLFKLQYADPNEIQQTLTTYLVPGTGNTYTSFVALPKSGALLVTESSTVIRSLFRLFEEVDVPPAEVVSEFISLQRADATEVVDKLKAIFERPQTPTGSPGSTPAPVPANAGAPVNADVPDEGTAAVAPGGQIELSENAIIIGMIKLTADVRTNRIHVVTRPVNMPFVRKLVDEFDSNIPFGDPTTRPLKFVSAGDVFPVLVKAISEPGTKAADAGGGAGGAAQPNTSSNQNSAGGVGIGGTDTGDTSGSFNVEEGLQPESKEIGPLAVTIGNTRIIADRRANSIIVLGNTEVKQKLFRILDELDIRAPQVMLNTVIGELTLNDDENFGVDYILRSGNLRGLIGNNNGNNNGGDGNGDGNGNGNNNRGNTNTGGVFTVGSDGSPSLNVGSIINSSSLARAGVAGGGGLTAFIAATDNLDIIVRALESTGRFRVTQRPAIFTSNNKKAIIASGQEVAVPTQTLTALNNTGNDNPAVSSSIQFKRVALQLEVVPLINSDREVALDILQKVDDVSGSTNIGGNQVPNITTRYIKTNVSVANGATVVLGGLIRRSDTRSVSGIPYLSRIPVMGALFRTTTKRKQRSELVILIRPCVTTSPDETQVASTHEIDRLKVPPEPEFVAGPSCSPTPDPVTQAVRTYK
jgi:general secretion pathway protein D